MAVTASLRARFLRASRAWDRSFPAGRAGGGSWAAARDVFFDAGRSGCSSALGTLPARCPLLFPVHVSAPRAERWAESKDKVTSGFVPAPS